MTSDFDELQKLAMADARKIYTETVIDHALRPRNVGGLEDADGVGRVTGPCGDTMQVWLKVDGDTIVDAAFSTDGCGPSLAAGSMITELAKGKSVLDTLRISQQDVLDALGGLPEDSVHCALLAVDTLKAAVKDYLAVKNESWRKAYR